MKGQFTAKPQIAKIRNYSIELIEAYERPRRSSQAQSAEGAIGSFAQVIERARPVGQIVAVVKFPSPPPPPVSRTKKKRSAGPGASRLKEKKGTGGTTPQVMLDRLNAARLRAASSVEYKTALEKKDLTGARKIIDDALAVEVDYIFGDMIVEGKGLPENARGMRGSVLVSAEAGLQLGGDTQDSMHSSEFINDLRDYLQDHDVQPLDTEANDILTHHVAKDTVENETGETTTTLEREQTGTTEESEDIWSEILAIFESMINPPKTEKSFKYYDRKSGPWSPGEASDEPGSGGDASEGSVGDQELSIGEGGNGEDEDDESTSDDEDDDDDDDDDDNDDEDDSDDTSEDEEADEDEEEEEPEEDEENPNPADDSAPYLAQIEMALDQLFGAGQRSRRQDREIALAAGGGYTDPSDQDDENARRRLVHAGDAGRHRFFTLGEYTAWRLVQEAVEAGTGGHADGREIRPLIPMLTRIQLDAILLMIGRGVTDPPETDSEPQPGRVPTNEAEVPRIIIRPPKARFAVIRLG